MCASSLRRKIVLGTAQFGLDYGISNVGGQTSISEVGIILEYAKSIGIDTLDTARAYGKSEEVLGMVGVDDLFVVSKLPPSNNHLEVESVFHQTLVNLKQSSIYGYLSHNAGMLLKNPKVWDVLVGLKSGNKVKKVGFSLYSPIELERLLQQDMVPDLVQFPFSFFDQRFKPYFSLLKSKNVEVHTRSTFLQGLFFMAPDSLVSFFDPLKPHLRSLQNDYPSKHELAGALLNFCLQESGIDKVIIGVNSKQQLKENVEALHSSHSLDDQSITTTVDPELVMPIYWPKHPRKDA